MSACAVRCKISIPDRDLDRRPASILCPFTDKSNQDAFPSPRTMLILRKGRHLEQADTKCDRSIKLIFTSQPEKLKRQNQISNF